jgi:hypothetical protein
MDEQGSYLEDIVRQEAIIDMIRNAPQGSAFVIIGSVMQDDEENFSVDALGSPNNLEILGLMERAKYLVVHTIHNEGETA